jgi:cytochrome c oxidase cbb3-type subunit 3
MQKLQHTSNWLKYLTATIAVVVLSSASNAFAAGPLVPAEISNDLAIVLLVVIVALLLCIGLLANVVMGAASIYMDKQKQAASADNGGTKLVALLALMLVSATVFAADGGAAQQAVSTTIGGLSKTSFYTLVSVIGLELFVILILLFNLKLLLKKEVAVVAVVPEEVAEAEESSFVKWWDKINKFRPIQEEANIDLGHNYDGIRELDNRLPPWWLYGFYLCIVFAGIYLYRYHVAHTAPLSGEELQIAMAKAEVEKEAYLKKAANKVDETNVTYMADAGALAEGKKLFTAMCAACHAADGGGLVGPNFTDDYWIHGGDIKSIFKTIKYGVAEKGMKSWKDDYSPSQMAQLASYIKSLKGTKPAVAKEPQGVLYEEKATADSTGVKKDSAAVVKQ